MNDKERRAELAQFLRIRRKRVASQHVGLPPGTRRRTPGLRREELAQLAGVGTTMYTWLLFTDPRYRAMAVDWEQEAQRFLALFRASTQCYVGESWLTELVQLGVNNSMVYAIKAFPW